MPKRPPKIVERKLGRQNYYGQYVPGRASIEIDPRQKSRRRMNTAIHETLHYLFPRMSETACKKAGYVIAAVLWRDRWKRVEK